MVSVLASLCVSAAIVGTASAHHGFGNFDTNKEETLKGTVTGLDFVNPHSYVYFSVIGDDGAKQPYRCEMRAATVLKRSGWSPDMFKPGEPITITGAPDRFDPRSCYVNTIVFADGTSADRYAQLSKPAQPAAAAATPRPARLPSGEPNISGDWAPEQVVMTDPRGKSGALVPVSQVGNYKPGERPAPPPGGGGFGRPRVEFTAAGKEAADKFRNFSPEDNPRMRCETTSILFDWTFDGPVDRITQSGDTITLQYGQYGFTRTIHMNAEHPAKIEPSRAGHSTGRWENDVLVVDTIGFAPGVLNPPITNSAQLHVIERFTLDPAAMKITRSYTATDPVVFNGEYTGSDTIAVADVPYAPDACKELTDHSHTPAPPPGAAPPVPGAAGAPAPGAAAAAAAPNGAPPEKPAATPKSWWKFWEWWN
ncbi:MAG TPA: DUF6152 family protein [Gammaproteobacteria bacterium]|nr:DUF6152 family protein [Gammaproteobacteria bacterium]